MEASAPYEDLVDQTLSEEPGYAAHLVASAYQCVIDGEPDVAQVLLADVCRGAVGYDAAAQGLGLSAEDLRAALQADPLPADLMLALLQRLQELTGNRVKVTVPAEEETEAAA
jgi:hypothetical protein